ncbi:MAG: asparagine synthase-related protein [Acidimicrobiales bacterium]
MTLPAVQPLSRMDEQEIAWGWVPGAPRAPKRPGRTGVSPIEALEAAILPALNRPPCILQFSGGIDSSVVLAVAVRTARKHGLAEPIAFTHRFPDIPDASEEKWQEQVVRFLGVTQWQCVDIHDEFDLVGPVAGPSLVRHGLLWPPMVHLRHFDFTRAAGGSSLDGEGGDEVFGPGRLAVVRAALRAGPKVSPGLAWRATLALAPRAIRRRVAGRLYRRRLRLPWLAPDAWSALELALAEEVAGEPLDNARRLLRHIALPMVVRFSDNFAALAASHDVLAVHPLLDRGFAGALGEAGGRIGFHDRRSAIRQLFADLLPDALIDRTSKASFNGAAFNVHSRAFAAQWDGSGVDSALVDVEALRAEWLSDTPSALSYALLQSAWLASR